jgi:hypothetical protein
MYESRKNINSSNTPIKVVWNPIFGIEYIDFTTPYIGVVKLKKSADAKGARIMQYMQQMKTLANRQIKK